MYANNEIGTIEPVKEIGKLLADIKRDTKSEYPYFHTDACQAGNYLSLHTKSLRVDMMSLNASKLYGGKGVGVLYKREGVKCLPISFGGGQERGLRSGTESLPLLASFTEALKEAQAIKDSEVKRLLELQVNTTRLLKENVQGLALYGEENSSAHGEYVALAKLPHIINFRIPGLSSDELVIRLDAKGFAVSHKSACASEAQDGSHVLMALGVDEKASKENIRVSMGRSTTKEDMKQFVEAVREIGEKYRNTP
jgi:cysteine desulfurase